MTEDEKINNKHRMMRNKSLTGHDLDLTFWSLFLDLDEEIDKNKDEPKEFF